MSFSSDLWNGFDILKSSFLKIFSKLKSFYEIMFSFASLEKNYTINLEILYEQYQNLFNSDELFLFPSKTFISNIKVECEYHKLFYTNIFENILSPLKNIIESKKKLIIKNFCDNIKNSERYEKVLHNLISNQKNYHNACEELALCISDIKIYNLNLEARKKQGTNKVLNNKRDKILEKIFRSQIDYLNILTESNIILKDYNTKTENILNNLEKEFTDIGECISILRQRSDIRSGIVVKRLGFKERIETVFMHHQNRTWCIDRIFRQIYTAIQSIERNGSRKQ